MTQLRKSQFWLDNKTGTLTEYTADLNQSDFERSVDILENTHLNENDKSKLSGIREASISINGYDNDATTSIWYAIDQAQGTSATKTFQIKRGSRYYNGECLPGGLKHSADGQKLAVASCKLDVDGAVNSTTVALS